MNRDELIAALKEIVSLYSQNTAALEQLNEDTDFIKDLEINSANLVDVVLDVEEKFNIEIDNDSMARMLTVKAAVEIIEEKVSAI